MEDHKTASQAEIASDSKISHIDRVITYKGIDPQKVEVYMMFEAKDEQWKAEENKKLLRKVDMRILPLLILMNLVNYLDRSNLAQARLGGLEKDLHMKGTNFNTATSIFFAGYLVFQLPSNLIITRVRPAWFLGSVMILWGVISLSQAFLHSYGGLLACRLILGVVEAPFFPGSVFFMSSWYKRSELAHRISWYFAGVSISNMFGGLLAAGVIGGLDGSRGYSGWRWLFIIEATLTFVVSIAAILFLPNYPKSTKWLTQEECDFAEWRLMNDTKEADTADAVGLSKGVKFALKDPRLYIFALLQMLALLAQSFQYFFPTIVNTLGYSKTTTLLLTAPVWFLAFCVALLVTYTSGRTGDRSVHLAILETISLIGFILVTACKSVPPRFFGMFLLPLGTVSSYQIVVSWVANSFPRPFVKRAVVIAICNTLANAGNIGGPYLFPKSDGPRYITGGAAGAAFCFSVILITVVIRFILQRENKKLEQADVANAAGDRAEDERGFGFRYVY